MGLRIWGVGGNNTEVPFSLYCVKAIDLVTGLSTRFSTADWFRPPGRSGSVRFLHDKPIHFSPFPCWTLWKEVTVHSPHLKQLHFAFLRAEYLHKLLGILLHGKSGFPLPFIYLIIYLLKYRLMILFSTLGYNPTLLYFVAIIVLALTTGSSFTSCTIYNF